MSVTVRMFAGFREAVGAERLDLPLADGPTVGALWATLLARYPGLAAQPPSAAVNRTFASPETELADGDEVAYLPPVSGG